MSTDGGPSSPATRARGRGRGKSRGGLGKYLRARGRGHARGGRPAEWRERLVLDDEQTVELDVESEEVKEAERKFSKRTLESNASRYEEKEEIDEDGEVVVEPEVDLSSFLARQRLDDAPKLDMTKDSEHPVKDDEVDHSLDHLPAATKRVPALMAQSRKGKAQQIEWDAQLEEMKREKDITEANRDLKARFRAKVERMKPAETLGGTVLSKRTARVDTSVEAPPLPIDPPPEPKPEKERLQDFLDDLLG